VTETDSPDIPPAWLKAEGIAFNEPAFVARITRELAVIRGLNDSEFALSVWRNAMQVLPRWSALCASKPNLTPAS
jgi:TatD DNase family protein